MLREELGGNRTDVSSVGSLSTQTFLYMPYWQRCWYVYMNVHCIICLQTLRYRFIYFLYIHSAHSVRILCSNNFTDSLITTLSTNNLMNSLSKAIATFITQPTKLGDGVLSLIHTDFVYPCVVHCNKKYSKLIYMLYIKYWQWNLSFMSLAATPLILILEVQPYNRQILSYWDLYICYSARTSLHCIRIIIQWFTTYLFFSISWNL